MLLETSVNSTGMYSMRVGALDSRLHKQYTSTGIEVYRTHTCCTQVQVHVLYDMSV